METHNQNKYNLIDRRQNSSVLDALSFTEADNDTDTTVWWQKVGRD
jgi:hypothetical protein